MMHSQRSPRFSESVHSIPDPPEGRPKPCEPLFFKLWVAIFTALLTIALAIALEVALSISQKNGGFAVPKKNVFPVSPQFLSAFFPTLVLLPISIVWRTIDWTLKWYYPFVKLSKDGGSAKETVLLDYFSIDPAEAIYRAYKNKHFIIFWLSATGLLALLLPAGAGAVFSIRQLPNTVAVTIISNATIGLAPDALSLNSFVAAAGFAEASAFHGLDDPPFVMGGWATTEFILPSNNFVNGTVTVQTSGLQTAANCALPLSQSLSQNNNSTFTISVLTSQRCPVAITSNPTTADAQFGVVNVPDCKTANAALDVELQPVLFWFFNGDAGNGGGGAVQTVFCRPTIQAFDVVAKVNLNSGRLANVTILHLHDQKNNVTGAPLLGRAFNAVIFPNSSNPFVQARAMAIRSGVPGAIFRFAAQQPEGLASGFTQSQSFLNITKRIYTQHLSLSAKSIYFVQEQSSLPARLTSLVPRLIVEPLAGHGLSVILLLIGCGGLAVNIIFHMQSGALSLASSPGTIASIASLTAHSGFGFSRSNYSNASVMHERILLPYATDADLERRLRGMHFRFDPRTGAIVVDDKHKHEYGVEAEDYKTIVGTAVGAGTGAGTSAGTSAGAGDAGVEEKEVQSLLWTQLTLDTLSPVLADDQ